MKSSIPDFPGLGKKAPPKPPKYLVQADGALLKISDDAPAPSKPVPGPSAPRAQVPPPKRYDAPGARSKQRVDSTSQAKRTPGDELMQAPPAHAGKPMHHIHSGGPRGQMPTPSAMLHPRAGPLGSHSRTAAGLILAPGGPLLNRGSNSAIVAPSALPAAYAMVNQGQPIAPAKIPVGPDNPASPLEGGDGNWCECWDDEAGAVYYYNDNTGEATWLRPDGVY